MVALLARAFAAQGSCYVISVGGLLRDEDIPDRYREIYPAPPENAGCSIIAPGGIIIASSTNIEETIVVAEADLSRALSAKSLCDIGGHYSRPDVLKLEINTEPSRRITKAGS